MYPKSPEGRHDPTPADAVPLLSIACGPYRRYGTAPAGSRSGILPCHEPPFLPIGMPTPLTPLQYRGEQDIRNTPEDLPSGEGALRAGTFPFQIC